MPFIYRALQQLMNLGVYSIRSFLINFSITVYRSDYYTQPLISTSAFNSKYFILFLVISPPG